jgi:hypothetical protein
MWMKARKWGDCPERPLAWRKSQSQKEVETPGRCAGILMKAISGVVEWFTSKLGEVKSFSL